MRRILMVPALVAGLALAGCGTTGGISGGVPALDSGTVAKVQATAQSICSFVPTATTVAKIIATFAGAGGIVDIAGEAASGICAAVAAVPKSLRRGVKRLAATPVYRGVRIQGQFSR